jgi:hypothetical protein
MELKGKKNLQRILRELSAESGIPRKTLERWWYKQEKEKTDRMKKFLTNEELQEPEVTPENNTEIPAATPAAPDAPLPLCAHCGTKPVYVRHTGKPYGQNSKAYGLCGACDARKRRHGTPNKEKFICPKCTYAFLPEEAKRTRK